MTATAILHFPPPTPSQKKSIGPLNTSTVFFQNSFGGRRDKNNMMIVSLVALEF